MEFHEKLQELRKQKNLTQEQLAQHLYVSRTAISKWELGRGYPSIDSLKEIATFFSITIDELLSGEELICAARYDRNDKIHALKDVVFGLLDCGVLFLLFVPLFGQAQGDYIMQVSLLHLTEAQGYIKFAYFFFIFLSALLGIATLSLQNWQQPQWIQLKSKLSMALSIFGVILFIMTLEPYATFFIFMFLLLKGALMLKSL